MDIFPFCRNCTSQSHGTAGNCKAGGFVNSAVTLLFTKPLISQLSAFPWIWLVQFLQNGKMSIGYEWSHQQECSQETIPVSGRQFGNLMNHAEIIRILCKWGCCNIAMWLVVVRSIMICKWGLTVHHSWLIDWWGALTNQNGEHERGHGDIERGYGCGHRRRHGMEQGT